MSENTKIVQCFLPPMVAGKYTVEVEQSIKKEDVSIQDIEKKFDFGVDAARFTINPTDIYSVYPPVNKYGHYSESLPHVILSRRTLPWERTIDGKPPVFQRTGTPSEKDTPQKSPPVPWVALILFDEDEMKDLKINISTLADIIQPNDTGVIRPEIFEYDNPDNDVLKLMEWDNKKEDGCFTIDITKEQFEKHIPTMESLSYLAHSKKVSIANKDKEGITDVDTEGTGVFSVIVGNRLPTPGKQHTAILVSIEGYINYLKDASPKKEIPENNKVRLVVLANWNFNNSGDTGFLQLVNEVEVKSMKIQRDNEATELLPYFDTGYAPFEHLTRNGATKLSWYHGPFIPKLSPTRSRSILFSSSDAALRYDRTTGFFDISFAAAWQLGRILALQNQNFSKSILNLRIEQKQKEVHENQRETVNSIVNDSSNRPLKEKVISYLGELNSIAVAKSEEQALKTSSEIPDTIMDFLKELYKLNGVPFSYLVPHEFFLEKQHKKQGKDYSGTLSLFYVDPNWVEALLGGALSIGRINNTGSILDEVMSGDMHDYTDQTIESSENKIENHPVRRLNITGFLFRSDLISGWRGIEIEAYDVDGELLPALRFERIEADIFLGIFNGNVASIVITEPYEGLHFGVKKNGGAYQKNLKNEDGSNQPVEDGTADVNEELKNGLIKDSILDISGLAKVMRQKLINKNWMNTEGVGNEKYFTSAEFAYQMVDSPVKRKISINMVVN